MSTKVVTAPASHAKRSVRSDKPAKQAAQQPAVNEDEARLAKDDSEQEVSVASVNEEKTASVETETSMATEFTFGTALAEAAAASGSLISDAQRADDVGFGAFGDDGGSTPLLLAAIGLAAVGLIFIVKDGGGGDDEVVPVNRAPTITAPAAATTAEDTVLQIAAPVTTDPDTGDVVTVTASVAAAQGTIVKNANGSFTFTPAANFNGAATITYSATDGKVAAPVTATQTVTVTAVNDAPTVTVAPVCSDQRRHHRNGHGYHRRRRCRSNCCHLGNRDQRHRRQERRWHFHLHPDCQLQWHCNGDGQCNRRNGNDHFDRQHHREPGERSGRSFSADCHDR